MEGVDRTTDNVEKGSKTTQKDEASFHNTLEQKLQWWMESCVKFLNPVLQQVGQPCGRMGANKTS